LALTLRCEQLPYRLFTTVDGLVRNSILRIRLDTTGYLWICTAEGLSLFDGSHFTNYTAADGLPGRQVSDLLPAGSGIYWLATDTGLYRFQPRRALHRGQNQNPSFELVPGPGGQTTGGIRILLKDREGRIWAGGANGLFLLNVAEGQARLRPIPLQPSAPNVDSLYQDIHRRFWIGTTDNGLYRYSESDAAAARVPIELPPEVPGVYAMHLDGQGRLWLAGWGLHCLDLDANPVRLIESLGHEFSPAVGERVFALLPARDGSVWIGGKELGILTPQKHNRQERFRTYETSQDLGREYITALEEDSEGNLWMGLGHLGLARISRDRFVRYSEADGLNMKAVTGMTESRQGALLAVSWGVWNEFDGRRFHTFVPGRPGFAKDSGWGVSRTVEQGRDGRWWAASMSGLLEYPAMDVPRQLARRMPSRLFTHLDGLASPEVVLQIFEDSRGRIWVGTLGGIARGDPSTGQWRSYGRFELGCYCPDRSVAAETIAEDRAGGIWVGIENVGLVRFRDAGFERFGQAIPQAINSLFVDSRGMLWIATHEGLWRIDHPEAGEPQARAVEVPGGLSSTEVFAVNEDASGRIYVSGGRGVDRIDLDKQEVRRFTTEDGLPPGQIEFIFRDRRGSLWFPTHDGLARYEPRPDEPARRSQLVFRKVRISGQPWMVSDLGEPALSGLELKPGQTDLDIELGTVKLSGERVRFQYLLEGAAAKWSAPLDLPSLTIAGLAPGRYRLLVRPVDTAGLISPETAEFDFRSIPAIWLRWWFQTLVILACAAAALALHLFRVARLLEIERLRTRIAADLHDDIGASLSQVTVLSEVIHHRSHDVALVQKQAEKIAVTSRELVGSMSDIVWAINPRNDSLTDIAQRMRQFAGEACAPRGIDCCVNASSDAFNGRLGPDIRRQLFLIFKEAVYNAVRHSGCTKIQIELLVERHMLLLLVNDNGHGFEAGKGCGNGLTNMRRRAKAVSGDLEIGDVAPGGVSVRLTLPLS
jgi:ligand-binding sensor domain-containing protein/signal transduction histidine kinase